MIVPSTYTVALLLTILSMICWGSWANTQKLAGKWRFELFYIDYSIGVLLAAVIAAFTFGMLGSELNFQDNLLITGKRQIAFCFAAGVVFNLANMLLVAAIAVAGMAVAFPIGIGLALVIGVVWSYILNPQGNPLLLFGGAAVVVAAIIVDAMAYGALAAARQPKQEPGARRRQGSPSAQGIILSCISGVLMGSFYPLVEMSKIGELGLGPYTVALIFAIGVFLSTFPFNLYFMNLPVQGPPLKFTYYFRGTKSQHLLGLAGGIIWCTGAVCNFTAASAPQSANVGPAVSYAMGQGATLISALWGILYWKEFEGAPPRVRTLITVMILLFVVGLGMVSIAPLA